jgi:hypothetical protein
MSDHVVDLKLDGFFVVPKSLWVLLVDVAALDRIL